MNFGIDPATGEQQWALNATPNLYSYNGYAPDPLGRYLYMFWDLRGQAHVSRIDITTGDMTNDATPGLSPDYLWPLDYPAFIAVGINEFVIINQDVAARARTLEYVDNYERGELRVQKEKSQNPWGTQHHADRHRSCV